MNDTEKPQFLLLLRNPYSAGGAGPSPEEMQHIMARFAQWMATLRATDSVVGTNGLEQHAGAVLRGSGGATVTDGPFVEAKEIVGGYILIRTDDLPQAIEIARGCPGLDFQLSVEVRPVKTHG